MSSFNSILVRLKENQQISIKREICKFQFHTGSIKSNYDALDTYLVREFQFHTGSIKSVAIRRWCE